MGTFTHMCICVQLRLQLRMLGLECEQYSCWAINNGYNMKITRTLRSLGHLVHKPAEKPVNTLYNFDPPPPCEWLEASPNGIPRLRWRFTQAPLHDRYRSPRNSHACTGLLGSEAKSRISLYAGSSAEATSKVKYYQITQSHWQEAKIRVYAYPAFITSTKILYSGSPAGNLGRL